MNVLYPRVLLEKGAGYLKQHAHRQLDDFADPGRGQYRDLEDRVCLLDRQARRIGGFLGQIRRLVLPVHLQAKLSAFRFLPLFEEFRLRFVMAGHCGYRLSRPHCHVTFLLVLFLLT